MAATLAECARATTAHTHAHTCTC